MKSKKVTIAGVTYNSTRLATISLNLYNGSRNQMYILRKYFKEVDKITGKEKRGSRNFVSKDYLLSRQTERRKAKMKKYLNETASHYNHQNRTLCYISGGVKCSIGRLISDKLCEELDKKVLTSVVHDTVYNSLPLRLRNLGKDYLVDLQSFHDEGANWTIDGLSCEGKKQYELLIWKIDNNVYKSLSPKVL